MFESVHVCNFYCFHTLHTHTHTPTHTLFPSRWCQSTDVDLSLLLVQRSLRASTLHFLGCRGAGQGQDAELFAGLMKHVYLGVCVYACVPIGRGGGSEMDVNMCVSVYSTTF